MFRLRTSEERQSKELQTTKKWFDKIFANFPWLWFINNEWTHDISSPCWLRIEISKMCDEFHFFLLSPRGEMSLRDTYDGEAMPVEAIWLHQENALVSRCQKVLWSKNTFVPVALNQLLLPRVKCFNVAVIYQRNEERVLRIFNWDESRYMQTALRLIECESRQRLNPD